MTKAAGPDPARETAATLEAARLFAWAKGDPDREDALVEATALVLRSGGGDIGARNVRDVAYRTLRRQRRTLNSRRRAKD